MRKWVLGVLLAIFSLGGLSVQAAPPDELADLGRYYSDDALFFASVRTDDAFFEELDALGDRLLPFVPEAERPPMGMLDMLNMQLEAETGGTLEETIYPWLGDTAAIGMTIDSTEQLDQDDPPFYATFAIDDREGALEYLREVAGETEFTESDENGFTLLTDSNGDIIAVGDEVLFLATNAVETLPYDGVDNPITASDDFTTLTTLLPNDDYNALVYFDAAQFQQLVFAEAEAEGTELPPFITELGQATSGQMVGLTILGGDTLTIDVAQQIDTSVYEELGIDYQTFGPVDLGFASRVPADAPLVIHGADFGPSVQLALDSVRAVADRLQQEETLAQLIESDGFTTLSDLERAAVNNVDLAWLLGVFNATFAGGTGMSFERDALTTLDGDIALWLRVQEADNFFLAPFLPDFGVLFQVSDPDAGATFMENLIAASEAYDTPFTTEDYGDGQALLIPQLSELFGSAIEQLGVLVAQSDDVFAIGTRPGVTDAIGDSGGVASNANFQAASENLLAEPSSVWFLNMQPVIDLVSSLAEQGRLPLSQDLADGMRALSAIETATISSNADGEGGAASRLTLTIAEEPFELEVPTQQTSAPALETSN